MADVRPSRRISVVDAIAGSLLSIIGLAAAWRAGGFDAESRPFPFVVAVLICLAGIGMLATAETAGKTRRIRHGESRGPVALAVLAAGAWILAMSYGTGFLLPTFALQLALLWITGIRGRIALPATAAAIAALAYVLFVVVLEIPMPPSRLPGPLQDF